MTTTQNPAPTSTDIAIVGMACRFPGAADYEQYWQNLIAGVDSVTEVPANRWDKDAFHSPDVREKNKSVSKWGGFMDGVEHFDASFFGVSAREAAVMDPQQRIMLELAWSCIEDAGYDAQAFGGTRTGVYVGVFTSDYRDHLGRALDSIEGHVSTGTHTALIPNRISHYLNLHGPSLPIDTACSSSLVALHEAAHAIRRGECEQALVGGVSVLCSPTHFISFSKTGMLSPDGRCKTFDARANGYVRGEGAAMVLLKPLDRALADKDRIVAVVRGSAMNHGGRARTVTYPSPLAQSQVIARALAEAAVPVGSVTYLEAHGTGTPKGDPIEIEGMKLAFARVAAERGEMLAPRSCAIGSAKTNIGHLESVAGLAGVIKTVQCMKYGRLPGLVHFQSMNPRIELDDSPFFLLDRARDWPAVPDEAGRALPRRAGVSSFGFGGVNAHVLLEESVAAPQAPQDGTALLVLSARTGDALRRRAGDLLAALGRDDVRAAGLHAVAWTLQAGRRPMNHRLALVAASFEDAVDQLERWLTDPQAAPAVRAAVITPEQQAALDGAAVGEGEAPRELDALAAWWLAGHAVNWNGLYPVQPRRVALPTYPFAREVHWIAAQPAAARAEVRLHPLVHENSSDFVGVRFTSQFSGTEPFLADHVVRDVPTLPGVAQLEMARAALALANPDAGPVALRDVAWVRPVTAAGPVELQLSLYPEADGRIEFDLYAAGDSADAPVYSQGTLVMQESERPAPADLAALRTRVRHHVDAAQCYAAFEAAGLRYGPAHRGIAGLDVADDLLLAHIRLPETARPSAGEYVLHPGLLDGCLQAALCLQAGSPERLAADPLPLPFALGLVEMHAPCVPEMIAIVRRAAGSAAGAGVQKFDIDLCDPAGAVCVRMRDFSTRAAAPAALDEPVQTALFAPLWRATEVASRVEPDGQRWVFACDGTDADAQALAAGLGGRECTAGSGDPDPAVAFEDNARLLLARLQQLARQPGTHLVQVLVRSTGAASLMAGLGGMLRTASLEHPNLLTQLIELDEDSDRAGACADNANAGTLHVRYVRGQRSELAWERTPAVAPQDTVWKERGVYLITGGAGGLGTIVARAIATAARGATLVLTGRAQLSQEILDRIRPLEALGAVVQYRQVDVADEAALGALVRAIPEEHESLDGIVHCAGVLRDSFLIHKTPDQLHEVLRAKVAGTLHLDRASRDMPLDCFICFASTSGTLGNVGQADYAAANAFMDAFARHRAALVRQGERRGRTLSIDWPLWQDGGMRMHAADVAALTRRTGLVPLAADAGVAALEQALCTGAPQLMAAQGHLDRFKASLARRDGRTPSASVTASAVPAVLPQDQLQTRATQYFVRLLSSTLKRSPESIDAHARLEEYGIDSILVMELTRTLEGVFGPLSKTLFFEYQTIAAVTAYFVEQHAATLAGVLGEAPAAAPAPASAAVPPPADPGERRRRRAAPARSSGQRTPAGEDIAIVGVAGRYPKARTLDDFWANLSQGVDCITEIPAERWDYRDYYDADRANPDKTYSKWGGFIDGVDQFDPLFFNISPREAERMDPQERLFLECAHAALEDAGYTRANLADGAGDVGVFVGVMYEEYQLYGAQEQARGGSLALLNSPASVANRVSYFCNFNGPSIALDTMCSSSLTALHLAVQSLQRGECSVAIAGGVNVSIHPNKYLMLAQGRFISGKGRCESFGEGGEGYVPGEGVGAVLLKPKSRAIADGDHIYGIVKATAVNHGGKTNGYTVPNPNAQAKVIEKALRSAGVDARAISYIEAHGTGTSLGDPIEIAGLAKAFQQWTGDTGFCAIGSAKSNIGHCESAAGIAGLTKVLLQLKHGQLAPSLHARALNPNIDFARTPFVVQQELAPWRRPTVDGRELPRVAGISSFGAGGANAHVVIEEYVPPAVTEAPASVTALVVLSARQEDQLRERLVRLLAALDAQPQLDLHAVAYTLQVGREAMDERIALLADSVDALRAALRRVLAGETGVENVFRGQVRRGKDGLAADDDIGRTVDAWLEKGKYAKLLELWVKGLPFDWERLHPRKPARVSLPTYPFARERYWVQLRASSAAAGGADRLHPLVHRNISDARGLRFAARFAGTEFHLADHVVDGRRLLPAVAQLEMVRAAVHLACGAGCRVRLEEVNWLRPAAVGADGLDVDVQLLPGEHDGEFAFEVNGRDGAGAALRFSEGWALVDGRDDGAPAACDLGAVRNRVSDAAIDTAAFYDRCARVGLQYGAAMRGIAELHARGDEALARIAVPAADGAASFGWHPGLLDAALQAAFALEDLRTLTVPYELESIDDVAPCGTEMWSVVRRRQDGRIDIDVCDDAGAVCVRLRGLALRALARDAGAAAALFVAPRWDVATPAWEAPPAGAVLVLGGSAAEQAALRAHCPAASVLDLPADASVEQIVAGLRPNLPLDHLVWIVGAPAQSAADPVAAQDEGVLRGYRLVKALLQLEQGDKPLGWTIVTRQTQTVHPADAADPAHAGVHGFVGAMAKELRNWQVRLADLPAQGPWPWQDILRLPPDATGEAWAYRSGQWFRQRLHTFRAEPAGPASAAPAAYRQGGVYVVIGGAGGIGQAWTEHMVRHWGARVVWIGRRERDAGIDAAIDRIAAFGPAPLYIAADAADRDALQEARAQILARHGAIHGVVHAAIALLDKSLAQMDEQRMRASLAAKIDVSVRMHEVFGGDALDFMLFFSSLLSFIKGAGQSNYAAGCTFKDAYALSLARSARYPVKVLNWGYWGSVGVVASDVYRERMAQQGLGSIEPEDGMRAVAQLLAAPLPQLGYLALSGRTRSGPVLDLIAPDTVTALAPRYPSAAAAVARMPAPDCPVDAPVYVQTKRDIDAAAAAVLAVELTALGWQRAGEQDIDAVLAQTGIAAGYRRWLAHSLRWLDRAGWPAVADAWAAWDGRQAQWRANPDLQAQVGLLDTMLRALRPILKGEIAATAVMFPDSSLERVEGVYRGNAMADYFNDVVCATVRAFVEERLRQDPAARIRILEIGAGTGGTSARVLASLRPFAAHVAEYCYTDLSRAFLRHAEEKFGPDYPFLSYRIFDAARPLAGQDIAAGTFDVVIATNVLHATRNIRASLRNAKAALAAHGLCVLNELNSAELWTHLTFGLLDGWWLYEDEPLRLAGSPCLSPALWAAVLRDEGFRHVGFPAERWHALGQQVVVAESDGIVDQRGTDAKGPARPAAAPAAARGSVDAGTADADLAARCALALKKLVGQVLKIPVGKIDGATALEQYGIDSILVLELTNALRGALGEHGPRGSIGSSLFFEYQTVDALVGHFMASEREALGRWLGTGPVAAAAPASPPVAPVPAAPAVQPRRARMRRPEHAATPGDVAIIGLSGRYPQAADVDAFWANLLAGRNCISEVPEWRWDHAQFFDPARNRPGKTYTRWGGFMADIECFDPLFFGIAPSEAETMSPQERLFIQEAYASIEDAGHTPATLAPNRKVGVFVGVMNERYAGGGRFWSIANRTSYLFDFHGPSMAVDTACSSSLTALHLAVESLKSGASEAAVVGGVNLIVAPQQLVDLAALTMLSSGDRCKAFAADGDGFVDGEAVVAVVLKPLQRALDDGDHVYGVIKGTAVNAGGKTNGYMVPNPLQQEAAVREAIERAGVDARAISYLEAQGTGSRLGDPIEIAGLTRAFRHWTADRQFCALGTAKSNVGHCESASGLVALSKVLMQMKHRTLVPSLHADVTNPEIDFAASPFVLQRDVAQWVAPARVAGISSFGAGGANAHAVVAEYAAPVAEADAGPHIVVLSARNAERLRERVARLHAALADPGHGLTLAGVAYTLQVGREALDERLALVAASLDDLRAQLGRVLDDDATAGAHRGQARRGKDALALFAGDEDLGTLVAGWHAKGRYGKIAELWVNGGPVDWAALHGPRTPRRVSLPTYPFARDRFWIAPQAAAAGAAPDVAVAAAAAAAAAAPATVAADPAQLRAAVLAMLRGVVASMLKVKQEDLDADAQWSEFGFDSITLTAFAGALNEAHGFGLAPTIFFEHPTLDSLAGYLAGTHGRALGGARAPAPAPIPAPAPSVPATRAPIAIIGISGEFPQAPTIDAFWEVLAEGRDCIREAPAGRWRGAGADEVEVRWGGFIDGIDRFDPLFFGISPKEAELMDPQQRLMMLHIWRALEDAGYAGAALAGSDTAIYVGTIASGYAHLAAQAGRRVEGYSSTGAVASVGPNRMSYFLDVHGPSEPVETACSSSLVALRRAVLALERGDCGLAIAGGVNTLVNPELHASFQKAGMLSPDGRCKTFSSQANGYVRGEGAGMVVLKRLADAERDGDHIYGLVRGTAENHGGRANSLTAPNPKAQAAVVRAAYENAGIDPRTVGYIEAHGTGTALGDPVEINGLKAAFAALYAAAEADVTRAHVGLGSAKTNVGHLELAAGITGVIKVLLQMKHRTLVRSLHADELNPYIDLAGSPFYVVQSQRPWQPCVDAHGQALPLRAGVSSFGFGGVNAHVVLEEYVAPVRPRVSRPGPQAVILSARTAERLQAQVRQLLAFVDRRAEPVALDDLAWTLQVGREAMEFRLATAVATPTELRARLAAFLAGGAAEGLFTGRAPAVRDPGGQVGAAGTDLAALLAGWVNGAPVDWPALQGPLPPHRISLPTYPFAEERYWIDDLPAGPPPAAHPLPTAAGRTQAVHRIGADDYRLADHVVGSAAILPGAAQLALVWETAGGQATGLRNVTWLRPIDTGSAAAGLLVSVGAGRFDIAAQGAEDSPFSHGEIVAGPAPAAEVLDLAAVRARCVAGRLDGAACYTRFGAAGLHYGPAFRAVQEIALGDGVATARLMLPAAAPALAEGALSPVLLDAALQAALGLLDQRQPATLLPFSLGALDLCAPPAPAMWAVVRGRAAAAGTVICDIDLCDDTGRVCVRLREFCLRAAVLPQASAAAAPVGAVAAVDDEAFAGKATRYFVRLLATTLKLPAQRIDPQARMEAYGIDSILVLELTRSLEEVFGPLPKTLFFEYPTIAALAGYFVARHRTHLEGLLGPAAAAFPVAATAPPSVPAVVPVPAAPAPDRSGEAMDIAIVGLAGRYPQAMDVEAFWRNLSAGKDCITEVPSERWDHGAYFDADRNKPGTTYGKWGGFIDDVDRFDPLFFNISPREAERMDPQERLFLQCVHETIEDAGYTRATLAGGSVGVFVGVMYEEYQLLGSRETAIFNSPASIANRVSYFCNFHGPSIALDTMCSSSLTALHLAVQSLRRGECRVAVAGGVNVSIHPNKYLMLAQGKFMSPTGRCESFGEGGEGYVPGEGVGAVLLKPKAQALADGDHIYGIVKATAVNHGGKTNGYTVPNPHAQAAVIERALRESGVDARAVSYIEAHGTGTSLGDPIEIAGLARAFGHWTQDTGFCAIGSAKSNIGHCESAAGIAGLTKVLLQMKHRQLVPSLHSRALNPNIDFETTPFRVQQTLAPWPQPVVAGRVLPRVAGISSFGAGGANAHVVIEEYEAPVAAAADGGPALIVLSARTDEQLLAQVRRLHAWLCDEPDLRLADVAYTLQVGREALDERLGLVVQSLDELRERLAAIGNGDTALDNVVRGRVAPDAGSLGSLAADDDMRAAVDAWLAKGKYGKLLDLWVKGFAFDWERLHARRPRRVSLPAYPFARERYWVAAPQAAGGTAAVLHPLLQRNTSTMAGQRYTTDLRGDEFYVAGHVVRGVRIVPAVVQLEMALMAGLDARDDGAALELHKVEWRQPLAVAADGTKVHVTLQPGARDALEFEIAAAVPDAETRVASAGMIVPAKRHPGRVDLAVLRAACTGGVTAGPDCYRRFDAMGLAYGTRLRCLVELATGEGLAVARLALPDGVRLTPYRGHALDAGLLDGALQAASGLVRDGLWLPVGVDTVRFHGPCSATMHAVVRLRGATAAAEATEARTPRIVDIDLANDDGDVCVQFVGVRLAAAPARVPSAQLLLLQPVWKTAAPQQALPTADRHAVLAIVDDERAGAALRTAFPHTGLAVVVADGDIPSTCAAASHALLGLLRAAVAGAAAVRVQVVADAGAANGILEGLAGMLRCAVREQPRCSGQLILAGRGQDLADVLRRELRDAAVVVSYLEGERRVRDWEACGPGAAFSWRAQGVYLITGGVGGLGLIVARAIAAGASGATLVLAGRSPLGEDTRRQLRALEALGARAVYRQVDVADRGAVRDLVAGIAGEFGPLTAVLHSAGVLRDSLLVNKTPAQLDAVLAPKLAGTLNLDEATRDQPLDYFVCFSSLAAVTGNVGQADYAAANGFMDAFAAQRQALVVRGERHGRTVSVDWPLWKDGGMQVDEATLAGLERTFGLQPLATADGVAALGAVLGLDAAQVVVAAGDRVRLADLIRGRQPQPQPQAPAVAAQPAQAEPRRDALERYLARTLAATLRLSADRIDPRARFETYGIDSVLVLELTRTLEGTFGALPKTLFYEYQTVAQLAAYFLQHHADAVASLAGPALPPAALPAPRPVPQPAARQGRRAPLQRADGDIAIIGVAGRYPQARTLDEFWTNLRDGRDCITEIPAARWDHARYFSEERGEPGKTYGKWGGFIDGVDEFDPLFFSISPREAESMDPQERLFLQTAYAALEDAGYTRDTVGGADRKVGVFVGVMYGEYQLHALQQGGAAVSNSPASIANRVSWFCDFNGPSLAVDTMCSSSLTALHLAVQSLRRGECRVAVAGGVNVSIHPNKYLTLAQGRFISAKGRCESFGLGGEGYVPGEGVGAVLLKPLDQALADGDRIHGVVKATAVNHGGHAHGYTVPNPNAQSEVIATALREAGIDARAINYVEAHGTGTSLGDPIEIAGLARAFRAWTADTQFCAVGSAKSNIGHCESAAGIAGLTKVLLQLRHRQLAPSLHAEELNPDIDFGSTPFRVQRTLADWERPQVDGVELPRMAGISSFGAGGANAHVIVEEWMGTEAAEQPAAGPALVVLSARNDARLRDGVAQLLAALERDPALSLADVAYTLQTGREAMEERIALAVHGMDELRAKLARIVAGDDRVDGVHRGQARRTRDAYAAFADEAELAPLLRAWAAQGKHGKLLDLWVKAFDVDWSVLYGERTPRRVGLPTYPFARQRCWIGGAQPQPQPESGARLHPLVHRNTSDIFGLQFSSRFTGAEFFLADHRVEGSGVLPAAAQLEMAYRGACAGLRMAGGLGLREVAWLRPVVAGRDGVQVHLVLHPEDEGTVAFELVDDADGAGAGVYGRGLAVAADLAVEAVRHDVEALLDDWADHHAAGDECYARFAAAGLRYGPAFRCIAELWGADDVAVARLVLPQSLHGSAAEFALHPSLIDAAFQAALGLQLGDSNPVLMLPSALDSLDLLQPCPAEAWALVRYSDGCHPEDAVRRLDIDVCDAAGLVCVRMTGFTLRRLVNDPRPPRTEPAATPAAAPAAAPVAVPAATPVSATVLAVPEWRPAVLGTRAAPARQVVLVAGDAAAVQAALPDAEVRVLATTDDPDAGYAAAAHVLLDLLRAGQRGREAVLVQIAVPATGAASAFAGLGGMLRSAALENPRIGGQVVVVDPDADMPGALRQAATVGAGELQATAGGLFARQWVEQPPGAAAAPWKDGGVYLVTGGAGGLGLITARDIASTVRNPVLVLTGRSAPDERVRAQVRGLEALGAVAHYRQLDVGDAAAVEALVLSIPEEFESLDGIVHSAGVLRDSLLANKTAEQLDAVLRAKVAGTVHLDRASRDIPLDCFICYSSLAAAHGNPGQSDYAAANGFMDAFAAHRNALVRGGMRHGRTLSIAWPLWDEGGMQVDAARRKLLAEQLGMHPLTTADGLGALHAACAGTADHVLVAAGDAQRLRAVLRLAPRDTRKTADDMRPAALFN